MITQLYLYVDNYSSLYKHFSEKDWQQRLNDIDGLVKWEVVLCFGQIFSFTC